MFGTISFYKIIAMIPYPNYPSLGSLSQFLHPLNFSKGVSPGWNLLARGSWFLRVSEFQNKPPKPRSLVPSVPFYSTINGLRLAGKNSNRQLYIRILTGLQMVS